MKQNGYSSTIIHTKFIYFLIPRSQSCTSYTFALLCMMSQPSAASIISTKPINLNVHLSNMQIQPLYTSFSHSSHRTLGSFLIQYIYPFFVLVSRTWPAIRICNYLSIISTLMYHPFCDYVDFNSKTRSYFSVAFPSLSIPSHPFELLTPCWFNDHCGSWQNKLFLSLLVAVSKCWPFTSSSNIQICCLVETLH